MTTMTQSKMAEFATAFQTFVPVSGLSSWNGVYTLKEKKKITFESSNDHF
jgi:hypothetical protein